MERKKAFIIPLIAFFLFLLIIFGTLFYRNAQFQGSSIFRESEKIKARNLAQAGLEKAMVYIQRKYSYGEYDVKYPTGKFVTDAFDKEMDREIEGVGRYRILSVQPFSYSDGHYNLTDYTNIPYVKNKKIIGRYDVWEVRSEGITVHKVGATLRTLIKIIRHEIVY
ncbi:hypothetical protein ACFL35_13210 [Candidatus Riflebacteria bacterium]